MWAFLFGPLSNSNRVNIITSGIIDGETEASRGIWPLYTKSPINKWEGGDHAQVHFFIPVWFSSLSVNICARDWVRHYHI